MSNGAMPTILIRLGLVFLLVGLLLLVVAILAWVGIIEGRGIFYLLGAVVSFVLHFILQSLGGQYIGGLR